MVKICVIAGALHWMLGADTFTLAWTHSVEKVRWEEDYRLDGRTLVLTSARVRGTGAGMEPPADAQWRDGAWHYTPAQVRFPRLLLANSRFGGAYTLCAAGDCGPLPAGESATPAIIEPCSS